MKDGRSEATTVYCYSTITNYLPLVPHPNLFLHRITSLIAGKHTAGEIENALEGGKRFLGRIGRRRLGGGGEGKTEGVEEVKSDKEEGGASTLQDLATHFYLLLLLMVSLPTAGTTEKKVIVVWRSKRARPRSTLETVWEEERIKEGRKGTGVRKSLSWCF